MKLDKPAGWELLRFLLITFSSSNPLSRLKREGRASRRCRIRVYRSQLGCADFQRVRLKGLGLVVNYQISYSLGSDKRKCLTLKGKTRTAKSVFERQEIFPDGVENYSAQSGNWFSTFTDFFFFSLFLSLTVLTKINYSETQKTVTTINISGILDRYKEKGNEEVRKLNRKQQRLSVWFCSLLAWEALCLNWLVITH